MLEPCTSLQKRETMTPPAPLPTITSPARVCPGFVTDLIQRCGRGDEVAFAALFDLFHRWVFAAVGTRVPLGRQEELVVTVFANMWRYASSHPPGDRNGVEWVTDHVREVVEAETLAEQRASELAGQTTARTDGRDLVVL